MADPIAGYEALIKHPKTQARLFGNAKNIGHGDMRAYRGNTDHHTGASGNSGPGSIQSHPSLGLCSQFFLPRTGPVWIVGYGIAYHGGSGSGYGITDINAQCTGLEMDNNGTEGWGSEQYWRGVWVNAVMHFTMKTPPLPGLEVPTFGHKEWAGATQGKWDPGGMNMAKRRSDIRQAMAELGAPVAPVVVRNEIDHVRSFSPWLGAPLSGEKDLRGKVPGKVRDYEWGHIYWIAATNSTVPVPKAIAEVYKRFDYENGLLGIPLMYHSIAKLKDKDGKAVIGPNGQTIDLGDVQGFKYGAIQRKYGKDGFALHGQIGERYAKEGWHESSLGWAVSDEYEQDGIIRQDFENGSLLCDRNGTVKIDTGDYLYVPPGR